MSFPSLFFSFLVSLIYSFVFRPLDSFVYLYFHSFFLSFPLDKLRMQHLQNNYLPLVLDASESIYILEDGEYLCELCVYCAHFLAQPLKEHSPVPSIWPHNRLGLQVVPARTQENASSGP